METESRRRTGRARESVVDAALRVPGLPAAALHVGAARRGIIPLGERFIALFSVLYKFLLPFLKPYLLGLLYPFSSI